MGFSVRIDVERGIYHVTNRGVNRQTVFFGDEDRVEFGRLLGEIFERFGIEVHGYCLMDNHYHLLVRCPDAGLSDAMQHLSSVFTRHTNDRVGRDGQLFRGRFHSIFVDSDRYFLRAVRYIHRNALDLPNVSDVDGYRWSSHRTYLGHRKRPPFLVIDRTLDYFGGDPVRFDAFVRNEFRPAAPGALDLDDLRCTIELAVALHDDSDAPNVGIHSLAGLDRTVALLTLSQLSPPDRQRSIERLAFPNDAARHNAIARARRRLASNPAIADVVRTVIHELGITRRAA